MLERSVPPPTAHPIGSRPIQVTPETVGRWERVMVDVAAPTFALLGTMVVERVEGHETTARRLGVLKGPPGAAGTVVLRIAS